ncbi:MAG TPA: hypothetical protein VHE30_14915 [Polyangiaceae bacterium]|nr:hypothetical protein [Polyangiaceae bacterium]
MTFEPIIQIQPAWTLVCGRFGVHFFEGDLSVADMDQMQREGDAWFGRHRDRIVELVVILPSRSVMSTEERRRMIGLIKHWEDHRVAAATVILAEGLLGAMHRSVLTGLLMLAPPPHPAKVFGDVAEAVTWLQPHVRSVCPEAVSARVVLDAVRKLEAAFRARGIRA